MRFLDYDDYTGAEAQQIIDDTEPAFVERVPEGWMLFKDEYEYETWLAQQ